MGGGAHVWSAADGPLLARIHARNRVGSAELTSVQERLGDHAYVLVDGPRLVVELDAPITGGGGDVDLLAERIAQAVAELRRFPDELDSIGYVGWNAGADAGLLAAAELSTALAAVVAVRARLRLVLPRLSSVAAPTLLIADTGDPWLLGRRALRGLPSESSLLRRSTTSEADARAVELIAAAWIERFTGSSPGSPAPERRHLNRRMRRRLAKLAPAAVLAVGAIAATGSSASSTCAPSFDAEHGILTITCTGDAGEAFTLSHLDGEILLDGNKVGAKIGDTTLVRAFGTPAGDKATIDETNGPFALPFEVDFKLGEGDQLTYLGQKLGDNSLLLKPDGVHLDGDGTVDIKLLDPDLLEFKLGDANDLVDASEWKLTDLKLYGEAGDDTLLGGFKADLLSGGPGLNKLIGGDGDDLLLEEITEFKYGATSFKLETTLDGSFFRSDALEGKQETESKIELIEAAEFKFLDDIGYKLDAAEWKLSEVKLFGGGGDDIFIGGFKVGLVDGGEGTDLLSEEISFAKFGATDFKLQTLVEGSFFKALDGSLLEAKIAGIESAEFKLLDDKGYKLDASEWKLSELKLFGGPGDDTLLGGFKADEILAGDGVDLLAGGAGFNKLDGGEGLDLLSERITEFKYDATSFKLETTLDGSFFKSDALEGKQETESKIELIEAAEFKFLDDIGYKLDASEWKLTDVRLFGGGGDDILLGGFKADSIVAGAGTDLLSAGVGFNTLDGGEGSDLLLEGITEFKYGATSFKLETTLDTSFFKSVEGKQETESKLEGLELLEFKFLDATGYKLDAAEWKLTDLRLFGGGGDDILLGGFKADAILAGDGADLLAAGAGINTLDGGAGSDLLREEITEFKYGATSFKLQTLAEGSFFKSDALEGKQETESKIELIEAAEFKFLDATGYKLDATEWKLTDLKLLGGAGDDVFFGGIKGETILAGLGDDIVAGGPGINALFGGGGVDKIQETLSSALFGTTSFALSDTFLKAGTTVTEFSDFDVLGFKFADALGYKLDASAFSQAMQLEGGDGPDTFIGSKFGDFLFGGGGADSVNGGLGDDKVGGGAGNDTLGGGGGLDLLTETADVSFKLSNTSLTGLGTDILSGFEAAALTGGANDNVLDASAFKAGPVTLFGLGKDDVLLGGSLADLLNGGVGDDELAAGRGNDSLFGELGDDELDGAAGTDAGDGGPGTDSCKSIEAPTSCEK